VLLLINGMWRAKTQYSWPASILTPISTIQTLNISGQYFSFDSDAGEFFTHPYYFETATYRVNAYSKAVWQLWIHYPPGYHSPSLKRLRTKARF
jgi:hypothetical protein